MRTEYNIYKVMFHKTAMVMMSIKNGNDTGGKITRDTGVTNSHVIHVLKQLEDLKLIEIAPKQGRIKIIKFTSLGKEIAEKIFVINTRLNDTLPYPKG